MSVLLERTQPYYVRVSGEQVSTRLMAIVAEGPRGRIYLAPSSEHEAAARKAKPDWRPEQSLPDDPRNFWTVQYGLTTYGDLFTPRQLVALATFADLIGEATERALHDAEAAGLAADGIPLRDGGTGARAYAEAIALYLACGLSRCADFWSSLCVWANQPKNELVAHLFGRQAIPMAWDFAEANPFSGSGGNFEKNVSYVSKGIDFLPGSGYGEIKQVDATTNDRSTNRVVSTDPPYYDNIGYADLSDYFYVWLRRSLRKYFPDLFATVAVPKAEELVATPYRHGGKEAAEAFFLNGMTLAMRQLVEQTHPAFPVTIYYAFKQSESQTDAGTASTGWETFLDAVIRAGFGVTGTWPIRTERTQGLKGSSNALASSIVLSCRRRSREAPVVTRREFTAELKAELPEALRHLQEGNIAPVDLAQAAIGPGMGVYTRFAKVVDSEGKSVSVREALSLINEVLDETLAEQEGDFDAESRFAIAWFEQHGFAEGVFGEADVLARAKVTAVDALVDAGILRSGRGKVCLLRPEDLAAAWNPDMNEQPTAWEVVHQIVHALSEGGEKAAGKIVAKLGTRSEAARELAYRLYVIAERKKRAPEALSYNALVQSWPEIVRLAQESGSAEPTQGGLFS